MPPNEIDELSRVSLGKLLDPYSRLPLFTGPVEDRRGEPLGKVLEGPNKQNDAMVREWRLRDMAQRLQRPLTPLEIAAGWSDIDRDSKTGI